LNNLPDTFFLDFSIYEIIDKVNNRLIKSECLLKHSLFIYKKFNPLYKPLKEFDINFKKVQLLGSHNFKGIPFVAKDIMNTKDFKTEMGSELWKGFEPGNNARLIDSIILKGGILVGKSVTSEFGIHAPNETLNPHNTLHKVGTSSSGSAVSVATGIVPFSLGTQTGGSISRPASFCGVFGMKPTYGLIPRTGILKTTDTLDNPGFISSRLESLRFILDAIRVKGKNYPYVYQNIDSKEISFKNQTINIGFIKTPIWRYAKSYVKEYINNLLEKLDSSEKYLTQEIKGIDQLNLMHKFHSILYDKSISYYFKEEYQRNPNLISKSTLEMIERGLKIEPEEFQEALQYQKNNIEIIDKVFSNYDAIITVGTSSSAPKIDEEEIPDTSLIWTMLGIPSVCIPAGKCPNNMPFGIHFISSKYNDYKLLDVLENLSKDEIISSKSIKFNAY